MKKITLKFEGIGQVYTRNEKGFIFAKKTRENVLDNITFELPEGAVTGLIGISGSGKSALARIASLKEKPGTGTLYYYGEDVGNYSGKKKKELHRHISFIAQDAHITMDLNRDARHIISGEKKPLDDESADTMKRIKNAMRYVGLNEKSLNRKALEFSGGQRQLLTIAGGIVNNPRLIIADQPLNSLDPETKKNMAELFRELAYKQNKTVLLIAHQLDVIQRYTDRLMVLDGGKLVEIGDTEDIFKHPQHSATKNLLNTHSRVMSLPSILAQKKATAS